MPVAMGKIPYGVPSLISRGYLTQDSFKSKYDAAPVAWGHWFDNDWLFSRQASYYATENGLHILHSLDSGSPTDAFVIDCLQRGEKLYWSYGPQSTPQGTRRTEQIRQALGFAGQEGPKQNVLLGHVSYVSRPGFTLQEPICLIG